MLCHKEREPYPAGPGGFDETYESHSSIGIYLGVVGALQERLGLRRLKLLSLFRITYLPSACNRSLQSHQKFMG